MKYTRNPDLIETDMDNDIVMMSIESGKYFGLSGLAKHIWLELKQPKSQAELVTCLINIYAVEEKKLNDDLEVFFKELTKNKIISLQ